MPMSQYPTLAELIWLFEAEANFDHDDIGWPVSGVGFESVRADWTIQCAIGIYDRSFRAIAYHRGERVFALHLDHCVDYITIDKRNGIEALAVWPVPSHDLREVRLQLKPHLQLDVSTVKPWDRH